MTVAAYATDVCACLWTIPAGRSIDDIRRADGELPTPESEAQPDVLAASRLRIILVKHPPSDSASRRVHVEERRRAVVPRTLRRLAVSAARYECASRTDAHRVVRLSPSAASQGMSRESMAAAAGRCRGVPFDFIQMRRCARRVGTAADLAAARRDDAEHGWFVGCRCRTAPGEDAMRVVKYRLWGS